MNKRGVHFQSLHWQKNITTGRNKRAQDVINSQVDDADMIIAIVGTRMGIDTGKAASGTAEEVFNFCERVGFENNNFNTHIFFNTTFDGNVLSLDPSQLIKVQEFQRQVSNLGIMYAPFSNPSTLGKLTREALDSFYFQSEQTADISLSDEENDEFGLEEHFAIAADNLSKATDLLSQIGVSFTKFGTQVESLKPEELLKKGVKAINQLGADIADHVNEVQEALDSSYANSMSGTNILIEDFDKEQNKSDVTDLIIAFKEMIVGGKSGYDSMVELEETIKKIPRRNRALIKAKKNVLRPVSVLKNTVADFNNNMSIICENLSAFVEE